MDALQTVVPRALASLLRNGPMSQGKLDVAWRLAVGDAISRAGSVHLVADGTVEVRTSDPHWRQEIRRASPVILNRLAALLGPEAVGRILVR